MGNLKKIKVRLFEVPLPEVLSDAKHGDHYHFELVTATITLEDGNEGTGYTYTGGKGGHAIQAMIQYDLNAIIGMDGDNIDGIYDFMEWHIHYVGRGGIASFAISAIDIALWDIKFRKAGQPLWKMAGGAGNNCKAYCGGIDLMFSLEKLLAVGIECCNVEHDKGKS
jgi:L-alanine-DL-glutamate epimerase-like enolase superfamily enzyme